MRSVLRYLDCKAGERWAWDWGWVLLKCQVYSIDAAYGFFFQNVHDEHCVIDLCMSFTMMYIEFRTACRQWLDTDTRVFNDNHRTRSHGKTLVQVLMRFCWP